MCERQRERERGEGEDYGLVSRAVVVPYRKCQLEAPLSELLSLSGTEAAVNPNFVLTGISCIVELR